jgi:hypothetical protein
MSKVFILTGLVILLNACKKEENPNPCINNIENRYCFRYTLQ